MELQAQLRSACCLELFFLHCSLLLLMVLPIEFFLENSRSLPSFEARGLSCGFHIFVSWAQKVDRARSSKNSSINVSVFWILLKKEGSRWPMGLLESDTKGFHKYLKSKCGNGHMQDYGTYLTFIFGAHFYYDNLLLFPNTLFN